MKSLYCSCIHHPQKPPFSLLLVDLMLLLLSNHQCTVHTIAQAHIKFDIETHCNIIVTLGRYSKEKHTHTKTLKSKQKYPI